MARPQFSKEQLLAQALRAKNGPTPQQLQQEEFGDNEFAIEVAKRMGYRGDIDPKRARFHPTKDDAELTMEGMYVLPDAPEGRKALKVPGNDRSYDIPREPDTVNVIGVHAANPSTWSHEYRHREKPGMSENQNRYQDAFNAQTKGDWDNAVRYYKDMILRQGTRISSEQAEKELLNNMKLRGYGMAKNEFDFDGAKPPPNQPGMFNFLLHDSAIYAADRIKNPYWAKLLRAQEAE